MSPSEARFHEAMLDVYRNARQRCQDNATYFLQRVSERGGLATARSRLQRSEPSSGFAELWQCGAGGLTVTSSMLYSWTSRASWQRRSTMAVEPGRGSMARRQDRELLALEPKGDHAMNSIHVRALVDEEGRVEVQLPEQLHGKLLDLIVVYEPVPEGEPDEAAQPAGWPPGLYEATAGAWQGEPLRRDC